MSSCGCQGVDKVFGDRTAEHDLRRYRKRGPAKSTRILLEQLMEEGVGGATVLDVGGGVGAVQQELLAAGAERATTVEASPAYVRAARAEAGRRGTLDRVEYVEGDFVAMADGVGPADIVTLDRVVCCYPDMEALVGRSADRARRLYGLVYPRDTWWVKVAFRTMNAFMLVTRRAFRVHVHATTAVDATARRSGLALRAHRRSGLIWQVVLYARS